VSHPKKVRRGENGTGKKEKKKKHLQEHSKTERPIFPPTKFTSISSFAVRKKSQDVSPRHGYLNKAKGKRKKRI
jgi:hypothetical protein